MRMMVPQMTFYKKFHDILFKNEYGINKFWK
jgi:hypothetical protein